MRDAPDGAEVIRTVYPGGSYCDALPDGERCILFFGSHVLTHAGSVPCPPGEQGPLFLRCTKAGIDGFKFAGQAHDSLNPASYQWTETRGWQAFPPPACGVSPLIYDRGGALHFSDCSIGSQGWRYCSESGHLWTGDETYSSTFGVWEWSRYRDLMIGQDHEGRGAVVWDGSVLRLLEPGDCRFIRVQGDGERVAISFWTPEDHCAVIIQTTLAELRNLPMISASLPAPSPVPIPVPPPKPEPVPVTNQLDTVKRIRAQYPRSNPGGAPLGEDAWIAIVAVAQAVGARVFRKDGGDHVFAPPLNHFISRTIIGRGTLGNQWVKVFSDGEGAAGAIWNVGDTPADGEYLDVSGVVLPGAPLPPPPVELPPAGDVEARLTALEGQLRALRALLRSA